MPHYKAGGHESHDDSSLTPLEMALIAKHGDLHKVIPELASQMTLAEVAKALDLGNGSPSHTFVRHWLRRHGYQRQTCYVRKGGAE